MHDLSIYRHRSGLVRTQRAIERGVLRLGFIGGSITAPYRTTWPEGVISWFVENYPGIRLHVHNVAIGATGSDLGALRVERDVLRHECDLVFVEYAVNDRATDRALRRRSQEGLVRKLLADEGRDVVFTYTYCPEMYEEVAADKVPESIADLDELAAHYGIGGVWMGLHAFREVCSGRMAWEEWLPDGLHPSHRGSWSYAQCVALFLQSELRDAANPKGIATGDSRPLALTSGNWEDLKVLPLQKVRLAGAWTIRASGYWWADQILDTAAVGARLSFDFTGRGVCLAFDFGKSSSEFRYRLDGSEWIPVMRERLPWCPESGWMRLHLISDELPEGDHWIEIEVIHGNRPDCTGTNFRLASIGIL